MIKLAIKNYCHDCLEFEPVVSKPKDPARDDMIIRCSNIQRCERIRRHLIEKVRD